MKRDTGTRCLFPLGGPTPHARESASWQRDCPRTKFIRVATRSAQIPLSFWLMGLELLRREFCQRLISRAASHEDTNIRWGLTFPCFACLLATRTTAKASRGHHLRPIYSLICTAEFYGAPTGRFVGGRADCLRGSSAGAAGRPAIQQCHPPGVPTCWTADAWQATYTWVS